MDVYSKRVILFKFSSAYSVCYRSVCRHPFLLMTFVFLVFLYRSFPFLFSLLVSASPVLFCTALLLGFLLSLGENDRIRKGNDVSAYRNLRFVEDDSKLKDRSGEFSRANCLGSCGWGVGDLEVEEAKKFKIGEQFDGLGDYTPLIDKCSQVIQCEKDEIVRSQNAEGNMKFFSVNREDRSVEVEEAIAEQRLQNEVHNNGRHSGLGDYVPLIDERFHGIEIEDKTKDKQVLKEEFNANDEKYSLNDRLEQKNEKSYDDSREEDRIIDNFDDNSEEEEEEEDGDFDSGSNSSLNDSKEDTSTGLDELHPLLGDGSQKKAYQSDDGSEEEDEEEDENHDESKSVIKWTEDDQKNVMDLGTSELERNQRLESLIAKRRSRRTVRTTAEKNLIDLEESDIPFNVPPISTRKNPFDLLSDSADDIPGSAPSVLLQRRNPFDVPYELNEEKPDGFQQEHSVFQRKETMFRRHESFSLRPSLFGRTEGREFSWRPYFPPERIVSESLDIPDLAGKLGNVEETNMSPIPDAESIFLALEEAKKHGDGYVSQEGEIVSTDDRASLHVERGSVSSEDAEYMNLKAGEKTDLDDSESEEVEISHGRSLNIHEGEDESGFLKREQRIHGCNRVKDPEISDQTCFESREGVTVTVENHHQKDPIYDSSPSALIKPLVFSSSLDDHGDLSEDTLEDKNEVNPEVSGSSSVTILAAEVAGKSVDSQDHLPTSDQVSEPVLNSTPDISDQSLIQASHDQKHDEERNSSDQDHNKNDHGTLKSDELEQIPADSADGDTMIHPEPSNLGASSGEDSCSYLSSSDQVDTKDDPSSSSVTYVNEDAPLQNEDEDDALSVKSDLTTDMEIEPNRDSISTRNEAKQESNDEEKTTH